MCRGFNLHACFFSGGNELSNQPFHIKWCWISFKQPEYTVAETDGLLEITVHRRGYLGETVYVGKLIQNSKK